MTAVEANHFSLATTLRCWGGHYSLPWIAPLYPGSVPDSAKQVGIKYHFLNFWYDSTWNWTPVSWATGKQSTHLTNVCIKSILGYFNLN